MLLAIPCFVIELALGALFRSHVFWSQTKSKALAASAALLAAAEAGNAAGVKAAYKDFMDITGISVKDYDAKTKEYTQGYSTEYDWKAYTNKGTIYIR